METGRLAEGGAEAIYDGFRRYHREFRRLTRRAATRFEERDWAGIRSDTVERLRLHPRAIGETLDRVGAALEGRLREHRLWAPMKDAFTRLILGRDDFELALTFFNSLSRRVFPHVGVDPAIDYAAEDFPVPYRGWEMASARTYAVRGIDGDVVAKVIRDAGFQVPFSALEEEAAAAAARIRRAVAAAPGGSVLAGLDVLRPVLYRNKGAYLVGRARKRDGPALPIALVVLNEGHGLFLDAVLPGEDEISIVLSFARWYFHADVGSPRQVIGFLHSILPRKRIAELYIALGYNKHGKTEFFRDLMGHIGATDERFEEAPGKKGMVMSVFTLPDYEFVFKVIKDHFPPQKFTTRQQVMDKYRLVLLHDRVGRLVDFQEFEHLTFPRSQFRESLLEELLAVAGKTVEEKGDDIVVKHLYVGRRVTPLDVFLQDAEPEAARAAVSDWGQALKDLAAANIFPGDMLLKNFGRTRHGRVVFYDYDELCPLTDCNFRRFPPARDDLDELSPEPWFSVGENDVFPEEFERFLGLDGELRDLFTAEHSELFDPDFWRRMQERNRRGEIIDFFPYTDSRRLRPGTVAAG